MKRTLFTRLYKPPSWIGKINWYDDVPDFKRSMAIIKLAKVDEVGDSWGRIGDFWFIFRISSASRVTLESLNSDLCSIFDAIIGRMEFNVSEKSYNYLDRKVTSVIYQAYEIINKCNKSAGDLLRQKLTSQIE